MLSRLRPVALVAALALISPAGAHANGDLASDVLLRDTLFVSTQPPSGETVQKLRGVIDRARGAGQPVRVALIHSREDLATVGNLFGYPAEYADYLARQVSSPAEPGARGNREALIVAMPAGLGTANAPGSADREVRSVELPSGASPDDVAAAAGYGVQQLAKATGHPIPAAFDAPDAGGGGPLVPILIVVALGAVIAVLVVVRLRSGADSAA